MRFERDILSLEASLEQALVVGGEIASRSYTPTTHQLLLASAVYSQPALEAMGDHPTQSVAMEGILATIKEKARNWGEQDLRLREEYLERSGGISPVTYLQGHWQVRESRSSLVERVWATRDAI